MYLVDIIDQDVIRSIMEQVLINSNGQDTEVSKTLLVYVHFKKKTGLGMFVKRSSLSSIIIEIYVHNKINIL